MPPLSEKTLTWTWQELIHWLFNVWLRANMTRLILKLFSGIAEGLSKLSDSDSTTWTKSSECVDDAIPCGPDTSFANPVLLPLLPHPHPKNAPGLNGC